MDRLARPTSNMSPAETEAWVSMAKDRSLKDWVSDGQYMKAMQRRMEALRRKREGLSV